ncbi:alpha/beta fold hydrolase [Thalassospira lucentensis]|uniref:alpha/beta fold hydrolase n=1 Tax=Thalassospira lucentensis TaxID=168935 RepID=UPI00399D7383
MKKNILSALFAGVAFAALCTASPASAADIKNVVIVHGAFADGSGWRHVSDILSAKGFHVSIVQPPETSLADDVAATNRVLALQDGPTVLVGHSYGGMIISDAGNAANVASLVYIAAFAPEKGESLADLANSKPVPDANPDAIKSTADGFLYLDPKIFPAAFAADLPPAEADFMARSQVFTAKSAFSVKAGDPAWKHKPSWALVATHDKSINPDLEREMAKRAGSTVVEVASSHAAYLAKPDEVAALIVDASKGAPQ